MQAYTALLDSVTHQTISHPSCRYTHAQRFTVGVADCNSAHVCVVATIMLKFLLLVNKQGQTRLSQYFEYVPVEERVTTEADIVRKCLARGEDSV